MRYLSKSVLTYSDSGSDCGGRNTKPLLSSEPILSSEDFNAGTNLSTHSLAQFIASLCWFFLPKVKAKSNITYLLGIKYSSANDSPINFNVKVGQMFWDIDYIASLNGTLTYDGTSYSVSEDLEFDSADGNDPYFGFGMTYDLNNSSSIDLGYFASEIHGDDISGFSLAYVSKF